MHARWQWRACWKEKVKDGRGMMASVDDDAGENDGAVDNPP